MRIVTAPAACPECRGAGGHWGGDGFEPCDGCDGTGRAVEIPREAAVQAYADTNGRAPWRRGAALAVSTRPAVRRGRVSPRRSGPGRWCFTATATRRAGKRCSSRRTPSKRRAGNAASSGTREIRPMHWPNGSASVRWFWEFDGGEARDDADRGAWHDLLRGTER